MYKLHDSAKIFIGILSNKYVIINSKKKLNVIC